MATQVGTIQRKVRNFLNDLKRARKNWAELSDDGFVLANALVNARLQQRYIEHRLFWHPALDSFKDLKEHYERKVGAMIENHALKLNKIVEKLATQHAKMKSHVAQLHIVVAQAQQSLGSEFVSERPLYLTCSLTKFVNSAQTILEMYTAEMNLKHTLSCTLPALTEREQGMVLLSAWLNQPNIDDGAVEVFEELCVIEMSEG